jgi:hypothetical protein
MRESLHGAGKSSSAERGKKVKQLAKIQPNKADTIHPNSSGY